MDGLRKAIKEFEAARTKFERSVARELPIGAHVSWMHGQHRQYGEVVRIGYRGRVLARNIFTKKQTWHEPYGLVRA